MCSIMGIESTRLSKEELKEYFDKDSWNRVNSQLVLFGRYICTSKNPKCDSCLFKEKCKLKK